MDRTKLGIIVACTMGNIVSMTPAVHSVFGLFLIPLSEQFGWPRAAISGVLGVIALVGAIVLPLVGRYADRFGARGPAILGNILLAIAIALLAFTDGSLTRFYLTFTFIAIAGSIASSPLFSKVVSDWFDTHRGAMLGISAGFGNGFGATLMPIAGAVMMAAFGWRGTYLGIAGLVLLLGLPTLFFLLRDAPRYAGGEAGRDIRADGLTLAQALRTPVFWLLVVAIASGGGALTAVFSHVVPILAERGIDVATATAVISIFALVTAAWQIGIGILLDRIPQARMIAPLYLVAVGGIALLALAGSAGTLALAGVLLGIGLGTQYGALPYFVARYFGLKHFGAIVGVLYSAVTLAQGFTPILLDHGFDVQGSYAGGMVAVGVALTVGAVLLLFLPGYRSAVRAGEAVGACRESAA